MGKNRFENSCRDILDSIKLLIEKRHYIPAVILMYCGMDIMAWLYRSEKKDSISKYFKRWTKKFFIPGSKLGCSTDDLWGGRCGLVHSYTSESDKSKAGSAKEILYEYFTGNQPEESKKYRKDCKKIGVKVVNIHDMFGAFLIAVKRFNDYLKKNPKKANLVYKRADKFFGIHSGYSKLPEVI